MKALQPFSCIKCFIIAGLMISVLGIGFIYSGLYPISADTQHNALTYWALEKLRKRSIARASSHIQVPDDLNSPERLLAGGMDYNDMCVSCHLKPGKTQSDLSLGLYPAPPNLTLISHEIEDSTSNAKQHFWVIKHGIKASAMPAWGITHDDERIWSMVAFIQRLPSLTPLQYQVLTSRSGTHMHH